MTSKILTLEPRSIVSIVDVINGGRKLAILDEKGMGYFDILGSDEMPKALLDGLEPVVQPQIPEMLSGLPQDEMEVLLQVWDKLTGDNFDVLTIYRAMRWAIDNKSGDADLIERMGLAATDQILAGRSVVERALT